MSTLRFQCAPRSFKLAFGPGVSVNIAEINEEILDSVSKYGERAVLAYTKQGRAVTFAELARNGITPEMEREPAESVKVLSFDFKEDRLFVLDRQSAIPLARLRLTVAYVPAVPESDGGESRSREEGIPPKPPVSEDDDYTADVFVRPMVR